MSLVLKINVDDARFNPDVEILTPHDLAASNGRSENCVARPVAPICGTPHS
jgi:hypothetical protein